MNEARVVVTGLGVISSVGIGWKPFWGSLLAGKSGITEVTSFDTSLSPTKRGGEVKDFLAENFIDASKMKRLSRATQFAVAATKAALQDACLEPGLSETSRGRIGVCIGTTMAEAQTLEKMDEIWVKEGTGPIPRRLVGQYPTNMIPAQVAAEFKFGGPNLAITTACAAGNYALSYAYDLLRFNRADVMIAGGTDAFSRAAWMGFNRLLAIAPDRCQPFDRNRKGMMVGEGCGILVLERLEDAIRRGALIYAELLGYGLSCDATHMTIPAVEGITRVIKQALINAGVEPENVSYINAHGTGTHANDRTECSAIFQVFSKDAKKIPVSSIKSMIGHAMGAASALEAIACVLAIRDNRVPPTINFEEPDPECEIDCVPNVSRELEVRVALNNSFAFGGNNASVVFGKCPLGSQREGHKK